MPGCFLYRTVGPPAEVGPEYLGQVQEGEERPVVVVDVDVVAVSIDEPANLIRDLGEDHGPAYRSRKNSASTGATASGLTSCA